MDEKIGNRLILGFCRLGVAGLAPKAPGTWGTAFACVLAPFIYLPLPVYGRCIFLVVLFFIGGWAAGKAEKILAQKDPGQVVIDELVGVWVAMLPFKSGIWMIITAFVCFRIFDIAKPWPVNASENWLPDGFGIMIDDVFAGIYAMGCIFALQWLNII